MMSASIKFVPGTVAPKYLDAYELTLEEVVITEQGTESRLPIVDFVTRMPDGKKVVLVLTGRIVSGIAAAVKGVNMRNHGTEDP